MADDIPAEEERLLARVRASLAAHAPAPAARGGKPAEETRRGYADEMVALRDEIGEARLEDVPQLVAQMERLQQVAARRADVVSAWLKRSKTWGRNSVEMPRPLSFTTS